MTIEEAMKELWVDDHQIFPEEEALAIGEAFGCKTYVPLIMDTRSQFKGATIPWAEKEGESVPAIGVRELAMQIAGHLNLDIHNEYHGYGSETRFILKKIEAHLKKSAPKG